MHRPVTITLRLGCLTRPSSTGSTGSASRAGSITSRATRGRRAAAGALLAVTTGAALTLGACSTQSPMQTQGPYLPADGVPASLGAVQARDLLVVAPSKGATGVLSGSVVNTGSEPVSLTFLSRAESEAGSGAGTTVKLGAGQQQRITGVQLAGLPAAPGDMTDIVLKSSAGEQYVSVPVLLPEGYYSTVTATSAQSVSPPTSATTSSDPAASVTLPVVTETTAGPTTPATPAPPTSPTG